MCDPQGNHELHTLDCLGEAWGLVEASGIGIRGQSLNHSSLLTVCVDLDMPLSLHLLSIRGDYCILRGEPRHAQALHSAWHNTSLCLYFISFIFFSDDPSLFGLSAVLSSKNFSNFPTCLNRRFILNDYTKFCNSTCKILVFLWHDAIFSI